MEIDNLEYFYDDIIIPGFKVVHSLIMLLKFHSNAKDCLFNL